MRTFIFARGHGHARLIAAGLGLRQSKWVYIDPDHPDAHIRLRGAMEPLVIIGHNGQWTSVLIDQELEVVKAVVVTVRTANTVANALEASKEQTRATRV